MNKNLLIIPLVILTLSACSTPFGQKADVIAGTVKALGAKTNDEAMDKARNFVCNNTYRAESQAMQRWNITAKEWSNFCGREARE